MTTVDRPTTDRPTPGRNGLDRSRLVAFDLYRDVHKGIRTELFTVTRAAGCLEPTNASARAALADQVDALADLLAFHAHHEDEAIDPVLEVHRPDLAETIASDHAVLDARIAAVADRTRSASEATADHRTALHFAYLDLASFTSAYLAHQDLEERVVMPILEQAVGVEALVGVHEAIIGSISPEWMGRSLALMLPAMNLDDRVEMLAGMRASAPADAFTGVLGLASSVLSGPDHEALLRRLGV